MTNNQARHNDGTYGHKLHPDADITLGQPAAADVLNNAAGTEKDPWQVQRPEGMSDKGVRRGLVDILPHLKEGDSRNPAVFARVSGWFLFLRPLPVLLPGLQGLRRHLPSPHVLRRRF